MFTLTRTAAPYTKVKVRRALTAAVVDGIVGDTEDLGAWSTLSGEDGVWELELPYCSHPEVLVVDEAPRGGRASTRVVRVVEGDGAGPFDLDDLDDVAAVATRPAGGLQAEAVSDGSVTRVGVIDGRLTVDTVRVLYPEDPAGGSEDGRATIELPDPAMVVGQRLTIVVPTDVPGPTLHAPKHVPAVLDITGLVVDPLLDHAEDPWTVTYRVGDELIVVTVDEDFEDAQALGAVLIGPLMQRAVSIISSYDVPQTEEDGEIGVTVAVAIVTDAVGPDARLEVVGVSGGDPLGMAEFASWQGAAQMLHGVDGWAKGHAFTHMNRDAGPAHGGVVEAFETEWLWVQYPADRSELTGYAVPGESGFFTESAPTNVGQALNLLHAAIPAPG